MTINLQLRKRGRLWFPPSLLLGNRLEGSAAFRACACCWAGNPDMPLRGCGPGPVASSQTSAINFNTPVARFHDATTLRRKLSNP